LWRIVLKVTGALVQVKELFGLLFVLQKNSKYNPVYIYYTLFN